MTPTSAQAWAAAFMDRSAIEGYGLGGGNPLSIIAVEWGRLFPDEALAFARRHWPNSAAWFAWITPRLPLSRVGFTTQGNSGAWPA